MRSSKSRSRSKQNRNRSVGNVVNRVFDSSGPEGKVRGTPQQIIEKYNQLARDAQLSNDRVATENFQQHAEHYLRLLGEAQREQEARREQQERDNRERQAERDRERNERSNSPAVEPVGQDVFMDDPSQSEQPDIASMPGVDQSMGLVDTPESQPSVSEVSSQEERSKAPRKPRAPRRKKPEPTADNPIVADSEAPAVGESESPEAAE